MKASDLPLSPSEDDMPGANRTSAAFKALNRIPLDNFQVLRRVVLAATVLLAVAALLFCSSLPQSGGLHEYIEAAGLALIFAAIVGRLWCTLYIGGRKAREIVETGPYSISRNPLYVFSSIGAAGVGCQTGSAVVGLLFGVFTALAFQLVIRREEAHLAEHFGPAYGAYCARVPRFWPSFSLFRDDEAVIVQPRRVYSTLFDGMVFVIAVPVFELIEHLQKSGFIPVVLHLP